MNRRIRKKREKQQLAQAIRELVTLAEKRQQMFSILERIAMDAQTRGKTLLSIDGQPIVLGSSVPMKGLTADENKKS